MRITDEIAEFGKVLTPIMLVGGFLLTLGMGYQRILDAIKTLTASVAALDKSFTEALDSLKGRADKAESRLDALERRR